MQLWLEWCACVKALRPACTRTATFRWMLLALAGFSIRADRAGVTSFVRALALHPRLYPRLLHLFHSKALRLDPLTERWTALCIDRLPLLRVRGALVCIGDGLKVGKEGRKMPAVKKLHQSSTNNSKPEFIDGHSLQALSLLALTPDGHAAAIPLAARIHEGIHDVPASGPRPTLLDRMVQLFLSLFAADPTTSAILVADAFYASGKVMRPLLEAGHHLVTRARSNAVAYRPAPRPRRPRPGRPRQYGEKVQVRRLFHASDVFQVAPSPVYGEHLRIEYRSVTLLWRPIAGPVQFVLVRHPQRGRIMLMTTDLQMDPLDVIRLYGYRFKIETGFRQAIHGLGTYAYHFWMSDMTPRRRGQGDQDLRRTSELYQAHVHRKLAAYHRYIQLGCIAQGLLQHLAIRFRDDVWHRFRSWLRTMNPTMPPSELVVAQALRNSLPEYLAGADPDDILAKQLSHHQDPAIIGCCRCAGG